MNQEKSHINKLITLPASEIKKLKKEAVNYGSVKEYLEFIIMNRSKVFSK